MPLAEGIQRIGFRKWYERQLLRSHGHLVLLLLAVLGLMAAMEAASKFKGLADQLTDGVAVVVCAAVGLWSLRRYLSLLKHAEYVASQADCPACGTYARFTLVRPVADGAQVRCRACERVWTIDA